MIDEKQVEQIRKLLFEARIGGRLDVRQLVTSDKTDDNAAIDSYVVSLGYHPLGKRWIKIDDTHALEIVTELLHRSRAYLSIRIPLDNAEKLAKQIVSLFSENTSYYTNWQNGWSPITDATFDMGIVLINEEKIGIYWVEEED